MHLYCIRTWPLTMASLLFFFILLTVVSYVTELLLQQHLLKSWMEI